MAQEALSLSNLQNLLDNDNDISIKIRKEREICQLLNQLKYFIHKYLEYMEKEYLTDDNPEFVNGYDSSHDMNQIIIKMSHQALKYLEAYKKWLRTTAINISIIATDERIADFQRTFDKLQQIHNSISQRKRTQL